MDQKWKNHFFFSTDGQCTFDLGSSEERTTYSISSHPNERIWRVYQWPMTNNNDPEEIPLYTKLTHAERGLEVSLSSCTGKGRPRWVVIIFCISPVLPKNRYSTVGWSDFFLVWQKTALNQRSGMILEVQIQIFGTKLPFTLKNKRRKTNSKFEF